MIRISLSIILLLFFLSISAQPQRFYIDLNAFGQNNGTSWADAFTNLHDALALAYPGDEIWVAQGIYRPTVTNNRDVYFQLPSGVHLYGGFAGVEILLEERNLETFSTIIDGDIGMENDSFDNSYNLMYLSYPDSNTVVDGFTFQYGQADKVTVGVGNLGVSGAAILINGFNGEAFPQILNCRFLKNYSRHDGGAVFINGGGNSLSSAKFRNCLFYYNSSARKGGAVCRFNGLSFNYGVDFSDCKFIGNHAATTGGAVHLRIIYSNDIIDFVNCTFTNNSTNINGTLRAKTISIDKSNQNISFINIQNCKFGGITTESHIATDPSTIPNEYCYFNLSKCTFKDEDFVINDGTYAGFGVVSWEIFDLGLPNDHTYSHIIDSCQFWLSGSSAISLPRAKAISVKKSIFTENKNFLSSRLTAFDGSLIIDNSIFIKSDTYYPPPLFYSSNFRRNVNFSADHIKLLENTLTGPDVKFNVDTLEVKNCILECDSFYLTSLTPSQTFKGVLQSNIFSFSPPFATTTWLQSNNHWLTDPMFVAPDSGDLRLRPCSPAINAGDNLYVSSPTDVYGAERIRFGTVDIGAVEMGDLNYQSPPVIMASCTDGSNGSADVSNVEACQPVTYHWSNTPTNNSPIQSGLPPGDYTVTITDSKSRSVVTTFNVAPIQPPVLTEAVLPVICGDTTGGAAAFVVDSNNGPFQFLWDNLSTDSLQTGLPIGTYTAVVTDQRGCTSAGTAYIIPSGNLMIDIDKTPITCYGLHDGEFSITPLNGAEPFQWHWEDGTTFPALTGLAPGEYSGTLTDGLGCSINWILPLVETDSIDAQIQITAATGEQSADGAILLNLTGGTGILSASWSNGDSGMIITNLLPGIYVGTITDVNNCTKTIAVSVQWSVNTQNAENIPVKIWPNPANEQLYIATESLKIPVQISLLDVHGRIVESLVIDGIGIQAIETGHFPAGNYWLKVISDKGVYGWQVIINHP